ncbi:MAG: phosphoenolpyruvate carboxylase [Pseudomonadota bacterium]
MPTDTASPRLTAAREFLKTEAKRIVADPHTNSVFALAYDQFAKLEAGTLAFRDVDGLVDEVHLSLAETRADAFRRQHNGAKPSKTWEGVEARLNALADEGWDAFKTAAEGPTGGIVFTAHPTFALPLDVRRAMASQAEAPTAKTRKALGAALRQDARAWTQSISLPGEHGEVQDALIHAQAAMSAYAALVLDVAANRFTDDWRTLRPALPTLASWVGYDLDGRTDIHWWQSVALRLSEKAMQLTRYAQRLTTLAGQNDDLADLAAALEAAAAHSVADASLFEADLSDPDQLITASESFGQADGARLNKLDDIREALTSIAAEAEMDLARQLLCLEAEMRTLQMGTARIHLRVNAAQVRAVLSRDLGLETEDRDLGRLALQQLSEKARTGGTSQVSLADLFLEQSTARRQIMMCALWLKHIDAGSPIRFLIAEAENPATVMGTLYMARQFGIEQMLDISPLFETPEALETGGRFISRLLDEPQFLDYIKSRGYLSIQLGFSDAGRFIGQVAADMAIERIHNLITQALADKAPGVGLLIFNTHGESMGRGAYPGTFEQRFDHVLSCWTRGQARTRGVALRHEVSFQGGDGFLHFATQTLAETTYGAWCKHVLSDPDECLDDPFYTERDFSWDTYRSLRKWHERLFNDPDYGHLLSDFATNFLVKAGSRQRRRSGGPTGPRALRAISHNATLQQLGVPVNTAAGLGSAIRREIERLITLIDRSPRMRHLLGLAVNARMLTSIPALRAYATVYNPAFWVAIAKHADPDTATAYRRVYYSLQSGETSDSIIRIANRFSIDLGKFDRLLDAISDSQSIEARHEGRLDLHVLHASRQALMMRALSLAAHLPTLSGRHDASLGEFLGLVREMKIGEAAALLERAFPKSSNALDKLKALSTQSSGDPAQGYDELHDDIISPLKEIDRLMHKLTLAIAQAYSAYG